MPRRFRIEYEDAIYHVMTRGNARQYIAHDDDDRRRLLADLERVVDRSGWLVLGFVIMCNHLHLLWKIGVSMENRCQFIFLRPLVFPVTPFCPDNMN